MAETYIFIWGNMTMKYRIEFHNGLTIITVKTSGWETMVQYVNGGDVTMVLVDATGEILFDSRDGWDIVTNGPARIENASNA